MVAVVLRQPLISPVPARPLERAARGMAVVEIRRVSAGLGVNRRTGFALEYVRLE